MESNDVFLANNGEVYATQDVWNAVRALQLEVDLLRQQNQDLLRRIDTMHSRLSLIEPRKEDSGN